MTMVVPRGLGLVAALAVSGTALYLVYELNKKRVYGSIRKGKGALRLEYHVRPHGLPEQQPTTLLKDPGGVGRGLRDGNEVGSVELHCQHLPCQRSAARRHFPSASSSLQRGEMQEGEEPLDNGLEECKVDEAGIKPADSKSTLSSYAADNQHQEECNEPLHDSEVVDFIEKSSEADSFDALYELNRGSSDFLSSTDDSEEFSEGPVVDNLVLQSSSSSSDEDCSSKSLSLAPVSSLSAASTAAGPPSPARSFAIVGCFIRSGNGSVAGKRKKVVRFSPSVTEPSSNNQDYRRRFKAQMAQRAAPNGHQRTSTQASSAMRSIVYDRPRLYSQAAARQAITYSVHRPEYRRVGRSY